MSTRKRSLKTLKTRPDAVESLVCEELTSPRALTTQVLDHLLAAHEVVGGEVVDWLRGKLAELESYELDLLLSPLFTPAFATRVRYEEALGKGCLDPTEVDDLIRRLETRELSMTLLHEGEQIEEPLPQVVLERFVRLAHLDSPLPEEALQDSGPLVPEVRCYLRDRAWRRLQSRRLVPSLLQAARSMGDDFPEYMHFLTDFLRSYRPRSREQCVTFLDNLAQAYKADLEKHRSGVRSFFNQELQAAYAGKWSVDGDVVTLHERMIAMAEALRKVLS